MVVDRRHPEEPFPVETTEHHDLQNHRDGLHHEETTDDRQQEMRTGREGERGEATSDRERPCVTHENLGGRGVPPQKADDAADHRSSHDSEVKGVGVVVEVGVAELPEPDDGEGGKAERPAPAASPSSHR